MIVVQPLIDSIKKELGSFFSTEAHTDSDIFRYINSAVSYIRNYRDFSFTKKVFSFVYTTASTESIIPYNIKTYQVKGPSGNLLQIMSNEEWLMNDDHTNAVGIAGDRFVAENTGTYQILYTGMQDQVTAAGDTIDMPPNFEYTLRQIAIHFGYKDRKQYDKAQALIGESNAFLNSVANRASNPTPSQPVLI
jgi:hypothetical protein